MQQKNGYGIEGMPAELRLHIAGFLDRASDMAAALMASRLFAVRSAVDMAVSEGAVYTGRVLEAGAPLHVVRRVVEARARPMGRGFVESAVRGGRTDVLRFICDLVNVDIHSDQYDPVKHDRDSDWRPHNDDSDASWHQNTRDHELQEDVAGDSAGDDGDEYSDDDTSDDDIEWDSTNKILYEALCAAADMGHVDALRYLTTREILGRTLTDFLDQELAIRAARFGHVSIVAYVHDRMYESHWADRCSCTPGLGRSAWKAPTPDAALWLRDFGCCGYAPPTVQDMGHAIAQGTIPMLRHLIDENAFDDDPSELAPFIMAAAREGHTDALRLAAENGLCPRIDHVVIGAAQGGSIDVLWWALYDQDDGMEIVRRQHWNEPSTALMRTASIAAASSGHATALAWICKRYPSVADLAVLCAAINSASLDAVRVVDQLLPPGFDWARVAARAIGSGSVDMVKFLIEEKAVALDPLAVADAGALTDAVADYLVTLCPLDDIQLAFDVALADDAFCLAPSTRRLCERVPRLCTAIGAIGSTGAGSCCSCARCAPTGPNAHLDRIGTNSHSRDHSP
ncbi:Ankyrin repeat protein [Pandoravirus kuranda]|uniref:Ankyrin repeat protein n=1 Tax=Pandoravirus kuranda TaxID=3019033 RepID=A0AA95EEP1_9VIRU|nr:Ankyrin repeat protein [Pandoravirus kuranda]